MGIIRFAKPYTHNNYKDLKEYGIMQYTEFVSVTHINEQLKQIVQLSRSVYLTALNAMLLSRRIDNKASGFSSVTRELQQFSKRLNEHVDRVERDITMLISDSASLVKTRRMKELFEQALDKAGPELPAQGKLAALSKIECLWKETETTKSASSHQVQATLSKLQDHYGIGNNLSVLAKIESSTIGQFKRELAAITRQIETVMNDIQICVDKAIQIQSEAA
jgi:hypothetical protein